METFNKVCFNSCQILSQSKIENSRIDLNYVTVTRLPKFYDNQSIPKRVHYGKLFTSMKGLKIHIYKSQKIISKVSELVKPQR